MSGRAMTVISPPTTRKPWRYRRPREGTTRERTQPTATTAGDRMPSWITTAAMSHAARARSSTSPTLVSNRNTP
jgi:hypothetical protein